MSTFERPFMVIAGPDWSLCKARTPEGPCGTLYQTRAPECPQHMQEWAAKQVTNLATPEEAA